jgi:hypothetical protein
MKLLMTDHQGWHSQGGPNPIDLPMNPDKIVCDIIESNLERFDKNKTFVKMWFSKLYHDSGNNLQYVQNEIYKITEDNSRDDLVFLCGHIIVNMLDFGNNKVLTYHGSNFNEHTITIPMPAFNYSTSPKNFSERKIKASFAGSFDTHWTRRHLWFSLRKENDCIIKDTGAWHYYKDKNSQTPDFNNFKDMLSNSMITLAPRGTGPCTIRLWEAIESLSIPLVVSDEYKDPCLGDFCLDNLVIRIKECEAQNVSEFINKIDKNSLRSKYNNLIQYTKKSYQERVLDTLKKELQNDR